MKRRLTLRKQTPHPPHDRSSLVAAAREAFCDIGPGAGLADLADRIGVGQAVLRRHFRDRDELVTAVLDDLIASLREDDAEALDGTKDETPQSVSSSHRYAVAPLVAIAAALPLAPAPAAAAVAEPTQGAVIEITPLWPVWSLDDSLQGSLCQTGDCSVMPYLPFSTTLGVHLLAERLDTAAAQSLAIPETGTVVFGFSHGAIVAGRWLTEHAGDVDAPTPDQLSFVLIGNPRRDHGGRLPAMPQTQYEVIDIVRQYDPMADFPDNPFNLLALLNIGGGVLSRIHLDYTGVDITDPANTVWTEGNTTFVFVPTPNLPLLAPLRMFGFSWLADALNEPLKEIVERAYDRPYLAHTPEPAETVAAEDDSAPEPADPLADDSSESIDVLSQGDPQDAAALDPDPSASDAADASACAPDEPPDTFSDTDPASDDVAASDVTAADEQPAPDDAPVDSTEGNDAEAQAVD